MVKNIILFLRIAPLNATATTAEVGQLGVNITVMKIEVLIIDKQKRVTCPECGTPTWLDKHIDTFLCSECMKMWTIYPDNRIKS